MHISISCPACSVKYLIKRDLAGRQFPCRRCGRLVQIPALDLHKSETSAAIPFSGEETEHLLDQHVPLQVPEDQILEDLGDLPPLVSTHRHRKRSAASDENEDPVLLELKQGYFGGMPIPILVSLFCGVTLLAYCLLMTLLRGIQGHPLAGSYYLLRILWIAWLTLGIYSGKILARYLSVILSLAGLFWGYHVSAHMIPLDTTITQISSANAYLSRAAVALQCTCWLINLLALLHPRSAEHCQEM